LYPASFGGTSGPSGGPDGACDVSRGQPHRRPDVRVPPRDSPKVPRPPSDPGGALGRTREGAPPMARSWRTTPNPAPWRVALGPNGDDARGHATLAHAPMALVGPPYPPARVPPGPRRRGRCVFRAGGGLERHRSTAFETPSRPCPERCGWRRRGARTSWHPVAALWKAPPGEARPPAALAGHAGRGPWVVIVSLAALSGSSPAPSRRW
jgi:hypothetical protein